MIENRKHHDPLTEEFELELAGAERVRKSQIEMVSEAFDDPEEIARETARFEKENWREEYVLGNFHSTLPGERDRWQIGGASVPRNAKTKDIYTDEEAQKKDSDHFPSPFFRSKTWGSFYDDVDQALEEAGFGKEDLSYLGDNAFRSENMSKLYRAYQLLRAKGYTHYDLAR